MAENNGRPSLKIQAIPYENIEKNEFYPDRVLPIRDTRYENTFYVRTCLQQGHNPPCVTIPGGCSVACPTGWKFEVPKGYKIVAEQCTNHNLNDCSVYAEVSNDGHFMIRVINNDNKTSKYITNGEPLARIFLVRVPDFNFYADEYGYGHTVSEGENNE